jgi:hypothetical protein
METELQYPVFLELAVFSDDSPFVDCTIEKVAQNLCRVRFSFSFSLGERDEDY